MQEKNDLKTQSEPAGTRSGWATSLSASEPPMVPFVFGQMLGTEVSLVAEMIHCKINKLIIIIIIIIIITKIK
jgi:hypothetical protein